MCKSPQYSVSPPKKQCRCEKRHGPFRKRHEISVLTTCKDTHIYKSNVLRCFSDCHPHHGPYGMVSGKLDFDFCLELFDTYSGKDYFFTEGGTGYWNTRRVNISSRLCTMRSLFRHSMMCDARRVRKPWRKFTPWRRCTFFAHMQKNVLFFCCIMNNSG